jgi:hypothetical protein
MPVDLYHHGIAIEGVIGLGHQFGPTDAAMLLLDQTERELVLALAHDSEIAVAVHRGRMDRAGRNGGSISGAGAGHGGGATRDKPGDEPDNNHEQQDAEQTPNATSIRRGQ